LNALLWPERIPIYYNEPLGIYDNYAVKAPRAGAISKGRKAA
jgi:hypothetical protein